MFICRFNLIFNILPVIRNGAYRRLNDFSLCGDLVELRGLVYLGSRRCIRYSLDQILWKNFQIKIDINILLNIILKFFSFAARIC